MEAFSLVWASIVGGWWHQQIGVEDNELRLY